MHYKHKILSNIFIQTFTNRLSDEGRSEQIDDWLNQYFAVFRNSVSPSKDKHYTAINNNEYAGYYDWWSSDTLEHFQDNYNSENLSLLKRFNWLTDKNEPVPIKYFINDWGFRCKQFSDTPGIAFFGCSMTFGTGLPQENTFAQIVSNHFNLECFNFGTPGRGLDYTSIFAKYKLKELCPNIKAICVYNPPVGRKTIFIPSKCSEIALDTIDNFLDLHWINYLAPYRDMAHLDKGSSLPVPLYESVLEHDVDPKTVLASSLFQTENMVIQELGSICILDSIAKEMNIPFILMTGEDAQWFPENADLARDLSHPGKNTNNSIAEMFIENLELDKY